MRIIYLGPLVRDPLPTPAGRSWAKHAYDVGGGSRYSSRLFSRDPAYTLAYLDGIDAAFVAEVEADSECFIVSVGSELIQTFDTPMLPAQVAALGAWLDDKGLPGDFLGRIASGCTGRQAAWYITSFAMYAQRTMRWGSRKSMREMLVTRGTGRDDRTKMRGLVARPWSDLSGTPQFRALKDEIVAGWNLWPHFGRFEDIDSQLADASVEQVLHEVIFRCDETFLGGHSLNVPEARNILRMLDGAAYGANRDEQFDDALDSASAYTNPTAGTDYNAFTVTGGQFVCGASIVSYGAQRTGTTLEDDQYSHAYLGTVTAPGGGDQVFLGADVRAQAGSDQDSIRGEITNISPHYRITYMDFDTFPLIDSAVASFPGGAFNHCIEVEGTTYHVGIDTGGGDAAVIEDASDATLSGGDAQIGCWRNSTDSYAYTRHRGGNFSAEPATDLTAWRLYDDDGGRA